MNIYKVSQTVNNDWDTFDSMIVVANSSDEARNIHPSEYKLGWSGVDTAETWADIKYLIVVKIGIAEDSYTKPEVLLASFNAG